MKTKGKIDLIIGTAFIAFASVLRPYDWGSLFLLFVGVPYAVHGWITSKNL